MPGRKFNTPTYRYGFNGKEKEDEIANTDGADLDFGARIYDARLGRWMACDPIAYKYPDMSPYSFVLNNPIRYIDPDGNVVIDELGQKVKVKIKKDKDGNYVASYTFRKNTDQTTIDEFYSNGAKVINAMIQTSTGRTLLQMMPLLEQALLQVKQELPMEQHQLIQKKLLGPQATLKIINPKS